MYPVMSILRRVAAHHVFVSEDHLELDEGQYYIRTATPSGHLDLLKGQWLPATDKIPIQELVCKASTSIAAAISLAETENALAESAKAANAVYTLVMGPESQSMEDGLVVRRSRYAAVRGVYRASASRLVPVKGRGLVKAQYSKPRRNVIRL